MEKNPLDFWDSKPNMIFPEFLGGSPVPGLGKNLSISAIFENHFMWHGESIPVLSSLVEDGKYQPK